MASGTDQTWNNVTINLDEISRGKDEPDGHT